MESTSDLEAEVSRMFADTRPGVRIHINSHVNASVQQNAPVVYNYITRDGAGDYRLCRASDSVHPSRVNRPISPKSGDVPTGFKKQYDKWTASQSG